MPALLDIAKSLLCFSTKSSSPRSIEARLVGKPVNRSAEAISVSSIWTFVRMEDAFVFCLGDLYTKP
jgi:hypothetical protein